jgi:hypothetical protein
MLLSYPAKRFARQAKEGSNHMQRDAVEYHRIRFDKVVVFFFRGLADITKDPVLVYFIIFSSKSVY